MLRQTDASGEPSDAHLPRTRRYRFSSESAKQLRHIAGDARDANLAVVLSALSAAWSRLFNRGEVVVSVPAQAFTSGRISLAIRFDRSRSLRDHLLFVRGRLMETWHKHADGPAKTPEVVLSLDEWAGEEAPLHLQLILDETPSIAIRQVPGHLGEDFPERMATGLDRFLAALAAPASPCAAVELLADEELERLDRAARGPVRDIPAATIHGVFEKQAASFPNNIAVIGGTEQYSYRQLVDWSASLAGRLRRDYGIGKGQRAGILADSSPAQLIAALAVWRAGAVCVPLSAEWPQARLDLILEAASPAVVICEEPDRGDFKGGIPHFGLGLASAIEPAEFKPVPVFPEDTAYILYTSGSTGEPKGVAVSHDSLVNMALDQIAFIGVTERDRVLQAFSPVFDASLLNMTLALFSGAALVTASRDERADGRALARLAARTGATIAAFVPSAFRAMDSGAWQGIRTLIFGGEPLTGADVSRAGPNRRIINSYGATETAVCVCAYDAGSRQHPDAVPIGSAIANMWVGVVDESGALVPDGCPGEIAVAGRGLAQGYCNDPAHTAVKFVPHPSAPGGRIYLTGDQGKRLEDGSILFLGRGDRQVKVRGFRVEPAEIECALLRHGGVEQAHVELREVERDGELMAWVAGGEALDETGIKAALAGQLPAHMVPARVVVVEAWPLTASGKTNFEALRAMPATSPGMSARGPRSPLEVRLRDVWRVVLGREGIGVDDDFFVLGGDSLKAMRLLARIHSELGLEFTLGEFFKASTIRNMAARPGSLGTGGPPELPRAAASSHYPVSFAQEGMYLLHRYGAPGPSFHMPRAYRIKGALDVPALRRALDHLVERHEPLRTRVVESGGDVGQQIEPAARIRMDEVDLRQAPPAPETLRRMVRAEIDRPFDLADPLKIRAHLFRVADSEHILLLTLHHIVSDGWSVHLLLEELGALYKAYTAGASPGLPPLTRSYRDFASWQSGYANSTRGRQDGEYWRARLAGLAGRVKPHPDLSRPPSRTYTSGVIRRQMPRHRIEVLRSFAGGRRVSVFAVLVASLKMLLHRLGCGDDIAVGTPGAGRVFPETEPLAGLFLNMLVLRDRVSGSTSFAELLPRVQHTITEALEHQAYPFELVAREVSDGRLFDVEIDFHPAGMRGKPEELDLSGTRSEWYESGFENAGKFDLDFLFTEDANGLGLELYYDSELFLAATAEKLADEMLRIVDRVITEPDVSPDRMGPIERAGAVSPTINARRARLSGVRGRSQVDSSSAVRVIEPNGAALPARVELDAAPDCGGAWLREQRARLDQLVARHGGVLFRGFGVDNVASFSALLEACGQRPIPYSERSSPRHTIGANVYTSTDHPADQDIKLHTEHSYAARWPMKIAFACLQPAARGGATPTADTRRVLAALPGAVVAKFEERGVGYVRNFGGGLGLDWTEAFCTKDPLEVEAYCQANGMRWEWLADNRLRVQWERPAVRRHPGTGELVWFNHAHFFNIFGLDPEVRQLLLRHGRPEDMPFQTVYGDGSPISKETVEAIAAVLQRETTIEPWQKGDVLLLDNMLRAHGRTAYSGQRLVAVAMSDIHESMGATG